MIRLYRDIITTGDYMHPYVTYIGSRRTPMLTGACLSLIAGRGAFEKGKVERT